MEQITSNNRPFFLTYGGLAGLVLLLLPYLALGGPADPVQGGKALPPPHTLALIDSLTTVGQLDAALERATRFRKEFGDDPRYGGAAEARLGLLMLRSGRPGEALDHLEDAVRKGPDRPEYHRNLGAALLELGRRGRALSEYRQAVEMAPRDFNLQLELGQLLLDFGDHNQAAGPLLTARRLCPDCPALQEPLAALFLAQRNPAAAIPILGHLWERDRLPATRRSLIQAMQQAGRDSSLLAFILEADPSGLPADEARLVAALEGRLGSWKQSLAWAAQGDVPSAVSQDADFWGQVSFNLLQAQMNEAALAAADRALALAPENVVYRNNRVVLLLRLGREAEAHDEWQKVLELDPSLDTSNPDSGEE